MSVLKHNAADEQWQQGVADLQANNSLHATWGPSVIHHREMAGGSQIADFHSMKYDVRTSFILCFPVSEHCSFSQWHYMIM